MLSTQQNNKQVKLTSDISFALKQAKKKLQAGEKLIYLNLSNHNIGSSSGIKLLSKALENNKTLTHINLRNSNIDDEGAKIVAKFLQNNNTVTQVDLSNNKIGRKVAKKLVKILNNKNIVSKIMVSFGDNENYDVNPNNIDPKLELLIENLENNYIETDGITIN
ncbi:hypothetical protein [Candidatus Tisiphia endosymbiont of Micropterix aruncella]|uniref:hypothetical protein n=1 Tax=Candidatus Tisiphia endosymbiont of Micropterix aruncella TaxID=3066271 RepID=UPI003AA86B05